MTTQSYSMPGQNISIIIPNETTIQIAKEEIKRISMLINNIRKSYEEDNSLVEMFATILLLSVAGYIVLRRKEN